MELNEAGLRKRTWWTERGYKLPEFDREAVREATGRGPVWVHFGAGNIFRAFPARAVQELLDQGIMDRGLVAAEGYDTEILERVNRPHDEYSVLVTLKADGTVEKTVVGSVLASYGLDGLKEIFTMDSLQIASFTITEKGYGVSGAEEDFKNGPDRAKTYMGQVAGLLYRRFLAGKKPIAMVSMDNCSHNGDRLLEAMETFAGKWCENGLADRGFLEYVTDRSRVAFPWTMIDKITPRPGQDVLKILEEDGLTGMEPVVTAKNTYAAPFVNAEECEYLVIEDDFPNGRPALEKAAAGADLLLCDSTYALPEQAAQAKQYGHSTFGQSAALAAKAGAKRLWLVHYSPMITDPEEELAQAQSLFPAAECGYDGKSITLQYEEA